MNELGVVATIKSIARIHTDFPTKFGVPRQSGLAPLLATIIFEPLYRNPSALRGLEGFSHIWLIWQFSEAVGSKVSPTVRPPRLGGNTRMGVFATRSPFRPNHLGLSSVKLEKIEMHSQWGPVLHVSGADMIDKTPIFDIKPYLPYADSHPEAASGFAVSHETYKLKVIFPERWLSLVPEPLRQGLHSVLEQDPRPAYVQDSERIFGIPFAGLDVRFIVVEDILTVVEIACLKT
nr:tRNA (N6-threonylcarbamoyladenosine(37)-N6)-methyltransferase TrmO [uncultured Anaeromusa sp.]